MDANLNRAREGLRVCEEVARFILEDVGLTGRFQRLRYELNAAAKPFLRNRLIQNRNASGDVGRPSLRFKNGRHRGLQDLVEANSCRVQEALRVLEEFSRLGSVQLSQAFGRLRFRSYTLAKEILLKLPAVRHR